MWFVRASYIYIYIEYVIIVFLYTEPTNEQLNVNRYAVPTYFDNIVSSSERTF